MDKITKYSLLCALFLMPAAGTLLHQRLHPNLDFLTYITLFDAIIITALFVKKSTANTAFILNTILAGAGLYHLVIKLDAGIVASIMYGLTDVMFVAVDLFLGLALYRLVQQEPKAVRQ